MAVLPVWRNHQKRRWERHRDSPTPGQVLGLDTRALTQDELLNRRLFPSHATLPPPLDLVYWRRMETRPIPNGTVHALQYAC